MHQMRMTTSVIPHLGYPWQLIASIMYGSGLRTDKAISLRVKDIDFDQHMIAVHSGKEEITFMTVLYSAMLKMQLELVAFPSMRIVIRFVIHLRLGYLSKETTFELFKSCWAIAVLKPSRFILMFCIKVF